jgi:hypothetical protein
MTAPAKVTTFEVVRVIHKYDAILYDLGRFIVCVDERTGALCVRMPDVFPDSHASLHPSRWAARRSARYGLHGDSFYSIASLRACPLSGREAALLDDFEAKVTLALPRTCRV